MGELDRCCSVTLWPDVCLWLNRHPATVIAISLALAMLAIGFAGQRGR
jgi:hypothetical protein